MEKIKQKRGPKIGISKTIDIPLVDLIRLFPASANIRVARRWALECGVQMGQEIIPSIVAAQIKDTVKYVKEVEIKEAEPKINLKVQDPEKDF